MPSTIQILPEPTSVDGKFHQDNLFPDPSLKDHKNHIIGTSRKWPDATIKDSPVKLLGRYKRGRKLDPRELLALKTLASLQKTDSDSDAFFKGSAVARFRGNTQGNDEYHLNTALHILLETFGADQRILLRGAQFTPFGTNAASIRNWGYRLSDVGAKFVELL